MTELGQYIKHSETTNLNYRVNDNNMGINQIILPVHESVPEIYSIRNIHMIIAMGRIIMQLDDQGELIYSPGHVIDIPGRTRMRIKNLSSEKTAILVMKL